MTTDLIARLREGEGADGELDVAISVHLDCWPYDRFTSSLDACITLAERVLPGWDWMKGWKNSITFGWSTQITISQRFYNPVVRDIEGPDLCRAFLIALILAKDTSHGAN